jgi:DNA-binding response OmpR family regulator
MENQATKAPRILVVEPDPLVLTGISAVLDMQGFRCVLARETSVALQATQSQSFDLLVMSIGSDWSLVERDVLGLRHTPGMKDVPIIFMTEVLPGDWPVKLNGLGGVYCLPKPIDPYQVIDLVQRTVWMSPLAHTRLAPPPAHFTKDWVRL